MSADILRRAASLMRENASRCADGWDLPYDCRTWKLAYYATPEGDLDAPHIASWHPAVALAVADWLDAVVGYGWFLCSPTGCSDKGCSDCSALLPALAVARAYLGETS